MSEAFASTAEFATTEAWLTILSITAGFVVVLGTGIATIGLAILRGMRADQRDIAKKQDAIWTWAVEETDKIENMINQRYALMDSELRSVKVWFRHEIRNLYTVIAQIAALSGKEGREIEGDIYKQMNKFDD